MDRETRIVVRPNESRWKRRKWYWAVQRRNGSSMNMIGGPSETVWGVWCESAHGYAANTVAAEDAARLWLAEEALTERIQQENMAAAVKRQERIAENTRIIPVEEN